MAVYDCSSPTVTVSVKLLMSDMVCVLIDSFYMHVYPLILPI